jgi:hypothetical protein
MSRRRKRTDRTQSPARGSRLPLSAPAAADTGTAPRPQEATPPPRATARTCGWCAGPISVKATGRLPKWCSSSCRQRAWEQARAAASGLSAVRIVERRVEVPTPATPTRRDWAPLLQELARQLGDGRIYDRDIPELTVALDAVLQAFRRHPGVRAR